MTSRKELLAQARQWVEQEKAWGNDFYVSGDETARRGLGDGATGGTGVKQPLRSKDETVSVLTKAAIPSPKSPQSPQSPLSSAPEKEVALAALYDRYKDCTRCRLGNTRIKFVFGVGSPAAQVLFIGEGPGYEEDRRGEPFVGKAGQLLDKIMASIGLTRQTNAYIANIVKCHPMANPDTPEARGNDRPPSPDEVETCAPILLQQIAILQPRVIITLGSPSTKMILKTKEAITQLRGKLVPFPVDAHYPVSLIDEKGPLAISPEIRERLRATPVLPTFHPAALLRNPNLKADTWTDMKLLRDLLGRKP